MFDEYEEFDEAAERAEYEFYLDAQFAEELSYQEKVAISLPRDTAQMNALEFVGRYGVTI